MKDVVSDTSKLEHEGNLGSRQLIGRLQNTARSALDPMVPIGGSVALLDYPNNTNVGDSLIWLGEIAYLHSRGISPRYVCDIDNFDPCRLRKALKPDSVILLHGGGNFGTLWPHEQKFRERVLMDFQDWPIVQFPQSIFFDDDHAVKQAAEAIRLHGRFTLLVRDNASLEYASRRFDCKVQLCPDMAFFIDPLKARAKEEFDSFILSRTDREKANEWVDRSIARDGGWSFDTGDWLGSGITEKIMYRMELHSESMRKVLDPNNAMLLRLWNVLSRARLKRGMSILGRGRTVITDRLHAHILSLLLDKPHVLIDNSYGKLGSFHAAWTKECRIVRTARDMAGALEAARELARTVEDEMEGYTPFPLVAE
jgi:pyruvyl transferase EpsO